MAFLELRNIRKSYFLGKEEFPVLKVSTSTLNWANSSPSWVSLVVVSPR